MDKRKAENLRVKQSITNALFALMREKSLSDVQITELVGRAGVARASFYRNYDSKEDVLITLIRDVLERFRGEISMERESFYCYENVLLSFQYFLKYRDYILNLCRSGFLSALLEELNRFHESVEGTMASSSIQRYQLYTYIGALLNTGLVWLSGDVRTTPEDIARYFWDAASKMLGRTDDPIAQPSSVSDSYPGQLVKPKMEYFI